MLRSSAKTKPASFIACSGLAAVKNGCTASLRYGFTNFHPSPTNPNSNLAQSPCDCSDKPWYRRSLAPGTTVTFYDELPRVGPGVVKTDSEASSWKCLLSLWALLFAVVAGIVWGIGSIIYQGIRSIIGWVGGLFEDPKSWIWFTAFDGTTSNDTTWFIPDVPVTQDGHTKTSAGPALAVYNGKLYMAYKSSGDDDIWYNVFDGNWFAQDFRITRYGSVYTSKSLPWLGSANCST